MYLFYLLKAPPVQVLETVEAILAEDNSEEKVLVVDDTGDRPQGNEGLVGEEKMETGVVRLTVYKTYWRAVGTYLGPLILISLFFMQGEYPFSDSRWLHFKPPPCYLN